MLKTMPNKLFTSTQRSRQHRKDDLMMTRGRKLGCLIIVYHRLFCSLTVSVRIAQTLTQERGTIADVFEMVHRDCDNTRLQIWAAQSIDSVLEGRSVQRDLCWPRWGRINCDGSIGIQDSPYVHGTAMHCIAMTKKDFDGHTNDIENTSHTIWCDNMVDGDIFDAAAVNDRVSCVDIVLESLLMWSNWRNMCIFALPYDFNNDLSIIDGCLRPNAYVVSFEEGIELRNEYPRRRRKYGLESLQGLSRRCHC
jgi:hypothetical protein